ncbi:hypothetical protein PR202_gb11449 [Eleusine coracana subsp. coracana]|uniref:F-box domain-containing protein n=1 Tax=Eleusine coracana subsp. coracana TaxID=191504 RepID=A0AAV5ENC0_ELECO|nr:hypothetical protein PR202_gb11449 [Eleusine coracana subsp. coracana]
MEHLQPDDVVAGLLTLLSPRDLAASRCVCRAWRALIDTYRLLRADFLPFSVGGIFFLPVSDIAFPPFFSCPLTGPAICSNLEQFGTGDLSFGQLKDHCNGLLLFSEHVVNPATGKWSRLPLPPPSPQPPGMKHFFFFLKWDEAFLPSMTPHV